MTAHLWDGRVATPLRRELGADGRISRRYAMRPASLSAMLAEAVSARTTGEALVFEESRWSWGELGLLVARLGGGLQAAGISAGDRIALLAENDPAFVLVAFAAAHVGAVLVPISAREQLVGVSHAIADSGAVILLHQHGLRAAVPAAGACGRLRLVIDIDSAAYQVLFGEPSAPAAVEEDAVAAILYTSGTTGPPKGVTLSHGAIVHSAISLVETMNLGPADRSIVAVPLSHVTGLVALLATVVRAKAALILQRNFSAGRFLEVAEQERMTHTVMVPAMYNLCLLNAHFAHRDLSAWRIAGFGGAAMTPMAITRLRDAAPRLRLINIYGATETTSPAVIMPPESAERRREAVGWPAPGCEILVMDEAGCEAAPGTIGELWIRGAMVSQGYWGQEEGGSDFADGFWRSGDLGSIDAEGFVTLNGRGTDVINRGGYKIYPAEIESALSTMPDVVEAAVVARRCSVLGERVHARVVVRPGSILDAAALRAPLALRFADYKVPESWDVGTGPLPRNANGKVLRRLIEQELAPFDGLGH